MATRTKLWAAAGLMGLLAVACGSNSGGTAAAAGGNSFSITSPSNGATVKQPFTVHVSTNAKLGPPSSGNDHYHLYYDGSQTNYTICSSASCQVSGLSPGKHVIQASLRNADHSPVGPTDTITVMVGGKGASGNGGGNGGNGGNGGGGGYGGGY